MEFHRETIRDIFKELYGVNVDLYTVNPYGKTVPQVIRELCNKYEILCNEKLLKELWEEKTWKELKREYIKVLPGVKELLEELKNKVTLGVLTGNTEKVGKKVLEEAGLLKYFSVFGFSKDELDRSKVLEKILEENPRYDKVVVIGDSPRDIRAAKKEKVFVIGVATGIYSEEDLKEHGADLVVPDLKSGKEKVLEFIFK